MLALIDQTVVFGIAGWLTYLEKEKGVVAGVSGNDIEDDETMGATPAGSDEEGDGE